MYIQCISEDVQGAKLLLIQRFWDTETVYYPAQNTHHMSKHAEHVYTLCIFKGNRVMYC